MVDELSQVSPDSESLKSNKKASSSLVDQNSQKEGGKQTNTSFNWLDVFVFRFPTLAGLFLFAFLFFVIVLWFWLPIPQKGTKQSYSVAMVTDSSGQRAVILQTNPKLSDSVSSLLISTDRGENWLYHPISQKEGFDRMKAEWFGDTLKCFIFNDSVYLRQDYFLTKHWLARTPEIKELNIQKVQNQEGFSGKLTNFIPAALAMEAPAKTPISNFQEKPNQDFGSSTNDSTFDNKIFDVVLDFKTEKVYALFYNDFLNSFNSFPSNFKNKFPLLGGNFIGYSLRPYRFPYPTFFVLDKQKSVFKIGKDGGFSENPSYSELLDYHIEFEEYSNFWFPNILDIDGRLFSKLYKNNKKLDQTESIRKMYCHNRKDSILASLGNHNLVFASKKENYKNMVTNTPIKLITLLHHWPGFGFCLFGIDKNGNPQAFKVISGKNQLEFKTFSIPQGVDSGIWNVWIILLAIFGASFFVFGLREYQKEKMLVTSTEEQKTIPNPLIIQPDKPTGEDSFNLFQAESETISKMITDTNTKGPLTFVIDAEWGQGKSSLMMNIKTKLEGKANVVCHWFNIWHYETEKDFLESVLLSVSGAIKKSIPLWSRLGLEMRWRWMVLSPWYKLIPIFLLALIGTPLFLFGIAKTFTGFDFMENWAWVKAFHSFSVYQSIELKLKNIDFNNLITKNQPGQFIGLTGTLLGALIALLTTLPAAWLGIKSVFRSNAFQRIESNQESNTREVFKTEFWNLLQFIGQQRTIVVFIDDADRVDGDKIKSMLQAINFMTDVASNPSGEFKVWGIGKGKWKKEDNPNIYFILGMWQERVAKNLGYVLGKEFEKKPDESEEDRAKRAGMFYIKKITDLVVPVPRFRNASIEALQSEFKSSNPPAETQNEQPA